jgi:hypothetical protein
MPELKQKIATALGCSADSIGEESGMDRHPHWDSVSHSRVLRMLAADYDLNLGNESLSTYVGICEAILGPHGVVDGI